MTGLLKALKTFGMVWDADCEPDPFIQHQGLTSPKLSCLNPCSHVPRYNVGVIFGYTLYFVYFMHYIAYSVLEG